MASRNPPALFPIIGPDAPLAQPKSRRNVMDCNSLHGYEQLEVISNFPVNCGNQITNQQLFPSKRGIS